MDGVPLSRAAPKIRENPGDIWLLALICVIFGSLCVLIPFLVLTVQHQWINNAYDGPKPITTRELRDLKNPTKLSTPLVKFTYEEHRNTNLGRVRNLGNQDVLSRIVLIKVEDRWLVAQVPGNYDGNTLEGEISVWTTPNKKDAIAKLAAEHPDEARLFLPYQLNAETNYQSSCISMIVLCAIGILIGLALFLAAAGLVVWRLLFKKSEATKPKPTAETGPWQDEEVKPQGP